MTFWNATIRIVQQTRQQGQQYSHLATFGGSDKREAVRGREASFSKVHGWEQKNSESKE